MRQIMEDGLLDGIDLNNLDIAQEDEISERIAQAYRRRQEQKRRERRERREKLLNVRYVFCTLTVVCCVFPIRSLCDFYGYVALESFRDLWSGLRRNG